MKHLSTELNIRESVLFLGFCDNIHNILQASDLLLFTSKWGEGMANVILEAKKL